MSARRSLRPLAAALAACALLLAVVPAAQASYDPVRSGTTKLKLDKGFLAFLKKNGMSLSATKPAKLKAGAITLPVSGGTVDPTLGKGEIEQLGSIVFAKGSRTLPLKNIVFKTKSSPLIAKVGGGQLKIANSSKVGATRKGFGTDFSAKSLKLTQKAITRLNKKLRPEEPFKTGQLLGSTSSQTQPLDLAVLPSGKATIVMTAEIVAKFDSLFVSINPISPAERSGLAFTFPALPGGTIAPDASAGTFRTGGDLEFLQLGGGQIFWHEFWFELAAAVGSPEVEVKPSPPYAGKAGRLPILDFSRAGAAISSDPNARTVTIANAPLPLPAATAQSLNEVFAKPLGKENVFVPGEPLGTLSFVAQTQ